MTPATTIPVLVIVPPRGDHKGFWSLGRSATVRKPDGSEEFVHTPGRLFPAGSTEVDVTPEEMAELKKDAAPRKIIDSGEAQGFKMHPGFITVVEIDPETVSKRRAETLAKHAEEAAIRAEQAMVEADIAAKAARNGGAYAASVEKPDPTKGGKR